MRRDLDLIRDILLFFESRQTVSVMGDSDIEKELAFDGFSYQEVAYHLRLMAQANLVVCEKVISSTSDRLVKVYPFELSWEGHEFLQLSKDNNRWRKLKHQLGDGFKGMTFEIAKALLIPMAKKHKSDSPELSGQCQRP